MENKQQFAKRLKMLREEQKLSYAKLATDLGVSSASLGYYERGERVPDIDVMYAICKYFNVSSDYLLGLDEYREHTHSSDFEKIGLSEKAMNNLLTLIITHDDICENVDMQRFDKEELSVKERQDIFADVLQHLANKRNINIYISEDVLKGTRYDVSFEWEELTSIKINFLNFLLENDKYLHEIAKKLDMAKFCFTEDSISICGVERKFGDEDKLFMLNSARSFMNSAIENLLNMAQMYIFGNEQGIMDLITAITKLSKQVSDNGNDNKA